MKEAIVLLKHSEVGMKEEAVEEYFKGKIGKNYLIRFLDWHSKLVSKLSSNFDQWWVKQSDRNII